MNLSSAPEGSSLQLPPVHGLKRLVCGQHCALVSLRLPLLAELLHVLRELGEPWAGSLQVGWRLSQSVLHVTSMSGNVQLHAATRWDVDRDSFSCSAWD